VVAVVMGGVFFWRMTHRMVQPAAQSAVSATQRSGASQEDYARKLEEELAKYG